MSLDKIFDFTVQAQIDIEDDQGETSSGGAGVSIDVTGGDGNVEVQSVTDPATGGLEVTATVSGTANGTASAPGVSPQEFSVVNGDVDDPASVTPSGASSAGWSYSFQNGPPAPSQEVTSTNAQEFPPNDNGNNDWGMNGDPSTPCNGNCGEAPMPSVECQIMSPQACQKPNLNLTTRCEGTVPVIDATWSWAGPYPDVHGNGGVRIWHLVRAGREGSLANLWHTTQSYHDTTELESDKYYYYTIFGSNASGDLYIDGEGGNLIWDFSYLSRTPSSDVQGIKTPNCSPASATITATPQVTTAPGTTTINWTTTNLPAGTTCSNNWNSFLPITPNTPGSDTRSGLPAGTYNFTINCTDGTQASTPFYVNSAPPPPGDNAPIGFIAEPQCSGPDQIYGWTCDADGFANNLPNNAHIYIGGTAYTTSLLANNPRPGDTGVAAQCGGNPAHWFSMSIPNQFRNNQTYSLDAFGISINSQGQPVNNNPALKRSDNNPSTTTWQFSCPVPPPPVINLTLTKEGGSPVTPADPRLTIREEEHVTLGWSVSNAQNCTASTDPVFQSSWPANKVNPASNPSGSVLITNTTQLGNYSFSLSCTNEAGGQAASTIQLRIDPRLKPFIQTTGGDVHTNESINIPQ